MLVEEDECDEELERETPSSVDTGSEVEYSVSVGGHEVDDLAWTELIETALGDRDSLKTVFLRY